MIFRSKTLFILRIRNPVFDTDDTVNSNVIFAAVHRGTAKIIFLLRMTTKVVFFLLLFTYIYLKVNEAFKIFCSSYFLYFDTGFIFTFNLLTESLRISIEERTTAINIYIFITHLTFTYEIIPLHQ